ncbi:uncharacterized protein LOC114959408 [Acropora millepora]|uniref:uncharacterized protein LOC114959408 n=1 Tax=Acropora millepora TaxID=45264 RepID=UPI001CF45688|nr:uncharacterized protein LOC114959408 [Acropora millepora]
MELIPTSPGVFLGQCRTEEVIRCQSLLKASSVDNDIGMMPFINHSFEEICSLAYDTRKPIVVVFLNPYSVSQLRESMLRFLQKIQEESNSDFFSFLVAAIPSPDGRKGQLNNIGMITSVLWSDNNTFY